jgi:hypothetical protein
MIVQSALHCICTLVNHLRLKSTKKDTAHFDPIQAIPFEITAESFDCKYSATTHSYDMKGKVMAWCLKNSSMKYGISATGGYEESEFGAVLA